MRVTPLLSPLKNNFLSTHSTSFGKDFKEKYSYKGKLELPAIQNSGNYDLDKISNLNTQYDVTASSTPRQGDTSPAYFFSPKPCSLNIDGEQIRNKPRKLQPLLFSPRNVQNDFNEYPFKKMNKEIDNFQKF